MSALARRTAVKPILLAAIALALAACGGAQQPTDVARVGHEAITQRQLASWMTQLAPEHLVPDPPSYSACVKRAQALALGTGADTGAREECRRQYRALQRQALALLLTWRWLLGQAQAQRLAIPASAVGARMRAEEASGPKAQLQARAELTAEALAHAALHAVPALTRAQLLAYYRAHLKKFWQPTVRYIELAENYYTAAEAAKVRREVVAGRVKLPSISIPEKLEGTYIPNGRATKPAARHAIFTAKAHVLSQPIDLNGSYSFFEITRIVPAHQRPFAQVERSLRSRLEHERREHALAAAVADWRARWRARTSCSPGYVIQKCRQRRGPSAPESRLAFD